LSDLLKPEGNLINLEGMDLKISYSFVVISGTFEGVFGFLSFLKNIVRTDGKW